jgi:PEP-CTERM/exosortase A-associated glycosyltransferase
MRVLHILHRSVPGTHGYAIRSREIVINQRRKGLEPLVVTSPSQSPLGSLDREHSESIEGIRYFRTSSDILPATREVHDTSPLRSAFRVAQNVSLLTTALRVARKYRPAVVHGHSPFTCGIVAALTGRIAGIPSIYEMRGIWEDSHTVRHGLADTSVRYRTVRTLENLALRSVDVCFAICEALKAEVMDRGIPADKIVVVPNGVDVERFAPCPPDPELVTKLGLDGKITMGYVGSFFSYEGLDVLLEAMIRLAAQYPHLRLLMVGDGECAPSLKERTSEAGITDRVLFTGRIPHMEITSYYRLFDFMVLPRREARETRLVTPLKPLEIMAMAKPLICSDIGGHREIVENRVNGVMFRSEDPADLAATCSNFIGNPGFRQDLGERGREWVRTNRDWSVLIDRYIEVYRELAAGREARAT